MEQTVQHIKCHKQTLEKKLYTEFDKEGDVVYSKQLRHEKSVIFEISESGAESEYDEWNRITFNKTSSGYWSMQFYDEPTDPTRVTVTPYQVVHKYWGLYNNLK